MNAALPGRLSCRVRTCAVCARRRLKSAVRRLRMTVPVAAAAAAPGELVPRPEPGLLSTGPPGGADTGPALAQQQRRLHSHQRLCLMRGVLLRYGQCCTDSHELQLPLLQFHACAKLNKRLFHVRRLSALTLTAHCKCMQLQRPATWLGEHPGLDEFAQCN